MTIEKKQVLAARLRAVRKRRGLRQRDAAREIGVSRKTYCRAESGYYSPRADTRVRFYGWLEEHEAPAVGAAAEVEDRDEAPDSDRGSSDRVPAAGVPVRLRLAILRKIGQG